MKNITKILTLTFVILLILTVSCGKKENLKVGAILPLSGPAAIWGENLKNSMELAREELTKEGINIEVIYEDSQAKPTEGLNAYNKLKNIDNVDIMLTAFSRVSVPLISIADQDKMPLIMTLVAAKGVADQSSFAFRFYSNERQYVDPHFEGLIKNKNYKKIAVLNINDEYGVSILDVIKERAAIAGIEITIDESFAPGNSDFKTQLTKLKSKNPEALLFVASTPVEVTNLIKQARELDLKADLIEASATLASKSTIVGLGEAVDGVYTITFPFSLGLTGSEFALKYKNNFGNEPLFIAPFGYDTIMMLAKATNGKSAKGEELVEKIIGLKKFDSLNGEVEIQSNGEINPRTLSAKILNKELIQA